MVRLPRWVLYINNVILAVGLACIAFLVLGLVAYWARTSSHGAPPPDQWSKPPIMVGAYNLQSHDYGADPNAGPDVIDIGGGYDLERLITFTVAAPPPTVLDFYRNALGGWFSRWQTIDPPLSGPSAARPPDLRYIASDGSLFVFEVTTRRIDDQHTGVVIRTSVLPEP